MITLYTWTTPNGRKVSIALEEMGLAYEVKTINIGKNEQFDPAFLAIAPNNRIPAIVDTDGPEPISIFESGAIMIHLAEKTGKFLPTDAKGRATTLQWLMWQMGGAGPMFGQMFHFVRYAPEKVPYAIDRYTKESQRLLGVLDKRLAAAEFMAGDYSIADMATYPWVAAMLGALGDDLRTEAAPLANVDRWIATVGARPAVERGMKVPEV